MPELAEVEYYRKQWLPAMGQSVTGVHLNKGKRVFRDTDTDALQRGLIRQTLTKCTAHGKQMCFHFGACHWLGVHLGMTGKTCIVPPGKHLEKHDHLVLRMSGDQSLVFSDPRMFGRILYSKSKLEPSWWASRGPAILSPDFSYEWMDTFLQRRLHSPIKAVLLVQKIFPGIGNWMADEILWRSRILPSRLCGEIKALQRRELYMRIREVSADAMRVIGTNWGKPPDDWLFNHRWRNGGYCPQTGKPLKRAQIGGRTTCWSPYWQT